MATKRCWQALLITMTTVIMAGVGVGRGEEAGVERVPIWPVDRGATDAAFTHFLPTGMDRRLRSRLTEDFLPGDFQRPVEVDREYVEATCLDTPAQGAGPRQRLAVPLINFSAERIESVTVRLPGSDAARQVRSLQHGVL